MKRLLPVVLLLALLLAIPMSVAAQVYSFRVDSQIADVYWQEDGTVDVEYRITFTNSTAADPIEYVDIGMPNGNFKLSNVTANVDGIPIQNIETSPFVENGIALGLGSNAIRPGNTGEVYLRVNGIERVLFSDDQDENYASAVFSTNYFDRDFVQGSSLIQVIYHFPPGLQPEEPRWHNAPSGFPSEPETGYDEQGRIVYSWANPTGKAYTAYKFGASFPNSYVPETAVFTATLSDRIQIPWDDMIGGCICTSFALFFFAITAVTMYSTRRRQLKYLPPKIAIEGHGIKRGLTAVEAAILMEQPMDKIMTMILFSTIKKGAATVITQDPLELELATPLPEDLRPYEVSFVKAFTKKGKEQRKALQDTMVDLIKSVSGKMKGFSRKETIDYYEEITRKAWAQVEAAGTPEVQSEKYDEVMDWTMLDRDFDRRTREVFRDRPIFVPVWWGRYDPTFGRAAGAPSAGTPAPSYPRGAGPSLPTLPGADFAASMVTSIQNFSGNVIGGLSDFTSGVTSKTNPVPKTSSSSFRGGGSGSGCVSCACACACAGCACACAGGGR